MTKKYNFNPLTGQMDMTDDGISILVEDYVQANLSQEIEDVVASRIYESTTTVLDTNEAVYGEDTKGEPDPTGQSFGWYFKNSESVTNKIWRNNGIVDVREYDSSYEFCYCDYMTKHIGKTNNNSYHFLFNFKE